MRNSRRFFTTLLLLFALSACSAVPRQAVPTAGPVFVPPTSAGELYQPGGQPTAPPIIESPPTSTPESNCISSLLFIEDLTIPDGTQVSPKQSIDKSWAVENSGTCNWDERYRIKLVGGPDLGAPAEQALYPARSGAKASIRIIFIAPEEPGVYRSAWQAFAPNGAAFGDLIFIEVEVVGEPEN